jgi:hypothetical protein
MLCALAPWRDGVLPLSGTENILTPTWKVMVDLFLRSAMMRV